MDLYQPISIFTTKTGSYNPFFNHGAVKKSSPGSAEIFLTRVRWKNQNQSLNNPEMIFNRDHNRDAKTCTGI
jgi:hypothetical protein